MARPGAASVVRGLREAPDTAAVTDEAVSRYRVEYPAGPGAEVTVVVAALNEENSIGAVLDEIPASLNGLTVQTVVVDDGSTDATGALARQHGARVCRLGRNLGHGAALRTGYRIAREDGSRFIATLDADGQWDPSDLPAMLAILQNDRADLVIGSRRLGATHNTDTVRNLGVRVFSLLIRVLTGARVTDSSSGLRAMRTELTAAVPQTQPQYQTSELVIGTVLRGYRIAEVPTVMRVRHSGQSRKGRNAFYAVRYAQVILRTYARERRARAVRRTATGRTPGT